MIQQTDEQEETRQIRGAESSGKCIPNSNIDTIARSQSFTNGLESIRADRDDGTARVGTVSRAERVTGEMLRQLISEYRNQLAIKKQEIESLENRVQELESLQEELEDEGSP